MAGKIIRVHNDFDKIINEEWRAHNREISKVNITKRIAAELRKLRNPVARINNYPFRSRLRVIRE